MQQHRKRHFRYAVSDMQLRAIGDVVVSWSAFEAWMELFVAKLVDDDEAIMTSFHVLPARKKLDRWRELTKSKLNEPWQSHIVKVIDRAAGMQQERDRIVHGMWGQSGEQVATSTNPLDGKITAFKWTGSKPPFDWKLSYPQIDNVAGKIDLLIRDLFQTVIDAWGSPPPLFGDAIKKMRHS